MHHPAKPTEMSVLDYLRARLHLPWRTLAGLGFALVGQLAFEPPGSDGWLGLVFYIIGGGLITWGLIASEIPILSPTEREHQLDPGTVRVLPLVLTALFSIAAFWFFGGNRLTGLNLLLWFASLCALLGAFALKPGWWNRPLDWIKDLLRNPKFVLTITDRTVAFALLVCVVIFFRLYRLADVPPEMYSDHAEKLLDVAEIMFGRYYIFFERNTGREMIQMYLTAAVAKVFGTGLSFMSLKIGTTLAGLLTLPFVYWLGKEFGGYRVGWLAAFFAGISYWLNVITRVALRYTLYPFFVAPLLFFLVRGLRRGSRNDMIWAGIFLGAGLHGYSAYRIVPFLVLVGVILFVIHARQALHRWQAAWHLGVLTVTSFVLFLPLLRYITESPAHLNLFFLRTLTRLSTVEQNYPGSPFKIFLQEMWDGMTMFWWNNGDIWVHSVRYRPALDVASAVLFFLGIFFLLNRYFRQHNWMDLLLVLSIVILLLPSTLSLAFPGENPSLNRSGGAMIPAAVIIAFGLETLIQGIQKTVQGRIGKFSAVIILCFFLTWAGIANYTLVFNTYATQYRTFILNTSEVGAVVKTLVQIAGSPDRVWVVPFPHWVDTRLIGIEAGFPLRDFAHRREDLGETVSIEGAKAFAVHLEDQPALDILVNLYPSGVIQRYTSVYGRDFWTFIVPAPGQ